MDVIELYERIKSGEDSKTQFKVKIDSIDQLAAEIVAFLNSEGGDLYIGVSDSGIPIGLELDTVRRINQHISNVCSNKILPPPISITTENIKVSPDKIVIRVNVPQGTNKYYETDKHEVWVKLGSDKRRASRDEVKRLLQSSGHFYADETPLEGSGLVDLDLQMFENFIERKTGENITSFNISVDKLLESLKLFKDTRCTLAGVLLFGKKPEIKRPTTIMKAVSFYGTDPSDNRYKDSRDIKGNIARLFMDGIAFLKSQLAMRQGDQGFNSIGRLEIPEDALEEALVNALLHRDYFVNSEIRLFVFDDRVEIISPGGLPNSITVESIKLGIHIERNPILVSLVKDIEGIPYRGIGTGIRRILTRCKEAGIRVEMIDDKSIQQFKIIFWRNK